MIKKILIAILSIFYCLTIFAGCNPGNVLLGEVDLSVEDVSTLNGSINVALQSSGNKKSIYEDAIKRYNQTRPNVKVYVSWNSNDDFYLSYNADVSTGLKFPDAALIDHVYIQSLASYNLIANINSVFDDTNYLSCLSEMIMLEEDYFAFPLVTNSVALYYNKKIIGDTPPKTWSEFIQICKGVKEKGNGEKPFTLWIGNNSSYGSMVMMSWVKRNGGDILSEDFTQSKINSDPVVETLTQWKFIADSGYASSSGGEEGLFKAGRIGMMESGPWHLPYFFGDDAQNPQDYGVAPLFSLGDSETDPPSSVLGAYTMCVTNQSDIGKMKLAADFSKFLTTDQETQLAIAKDSFGIPALKEACNDDFYTKGKYAPYWKVFLDHITTATLRPGSSEWQYINSQLGNMVSSVMSGDKTPGTAASDTSNLVQRKIDSRLEE